MKRIFTLSLIVLFTCFFSGKADAQLNIPIANCQNISGTYIDLDTNGSVITTANFDDANSSAVNIGFTFHFNGQNFTQFVLNTNGFIKLGSTSPSSASLFYTTANGIVGGVFNSINQADQNIIAAFNHDLTGGANPEFRVHTSGTAPNRKCVIQYKDMRDKTTNPAEQFASLNFQIILYETSNIVDIVYGTFTPTVNPDNWKTVAVGLKGSGFGSAQLVAVTKASTSPYSSASFIQGNYTGNAFNVRSSVLPDPGRTLRFMPIKPNDLAIVQAYTMGKSPIPFGNPLTVSAWVKNVGTNSMPASTCTLDITGANTFSNVQNIPLLTPGDSTFVTFSSFSPTNTGSNTVTVTIPADDNLMNNTVIKNLETTSNAYSYAQSPIPDGGVGFNGASGDFVAKFSMASAQSINQVNVHFSTGGQPFQIGIWTAHPTTGNPYTLLYSTSTHTSTSGVYTVLIDPPVSIPVGDFFVGVRQIGTTNVSFAFQYEVPIRPNTFYFTSPTGGTSWNDFAPNNHFRFMIEPRFALQEDVGVYAVQPSTGTTLVAGETYDIKAVVVNYGVQSQNNIPVYYNIDGGTPIGPINTTTSINTNDTTSITFTGANAFSPTTPGTYTIKVFSQLTSDLNTQNDTTTVTYTVIPPPISTFPYYENFSDPQHWTISGITSLWQYGIAPKGATGLSDDTAVFATFYSTYAGNRAMLKTPAFDFSGINNPTLTFDVAYRTSSIENDSLEVLVSTDGGLTFVTGSPRIYLKSAYSTPSLATLPADTARFFPSDTTHWRREMVSLQQFESEPNVIIAFHARSQYGNNCWIDNVNVFSGSLATVTTDPVTSITQNTAVTGGEVTAIGSAPVTACGVCWSSSPEPTLSHSYTVNGAGLGSFTSNIINLAPGSTYYVRAYATNSVGTVYGNEEVFTTVAPATAPIVTTSPVTNVSHYSAETGGVVVSDGGEPLSARGVCYSTSPNPTIADAFTNEGTDTGAFVSTITSLQENTTYYVKAYATNIIGVSYGQEESFTTLIDAVDEVSESLFRVFYSNKTLQFISSESIIIDNLTIMDASGREIKSFSSLNCSPTLELRLDDIPYGIYILNIYTNDNNFQRKLLIY